MTLIELRIIFILFIMYLFVLVWTVLVSLLPDSDYGNGDSRGNKQIPTSSPDRDATSKQKHRQKRWLQVDEPDYLEEFNLSHKHRQD